MGLLPAWGQGTPTPDAPGIAWTGQMGNKALLMGRDSPPKAVAPGERFEGYTLVEMQADSVTVEREGRQYRLRAGEGQAALSATPADGQVQVVLFGGQGGHFRADGQINGHYAELLIDTGASLVALGSNQAGPLGIDLKSAPRITVQTANGHNWGHRVTLNSIRIGQITVHQIPAIVLSTPMPYVLLGNSFLARFDMQRSGNRLVLTRRY